MNDIVERLRTWSHNAVGDVTGPMMREAADEIERLYDENHTFREEIVMLADMKANLHGHIKRLEDENAKLRAVRDSLGADLLEVQRECIKLRECLRFFRSAIQSGEDWTDTCEQAYRAALNYSPQQDSS